MAVTLVVIKLGGGLITDKAKPLRARHRRIKALAEEIAAIYRTQSVDLLLGNGAGSFGHHSAHEYGLKGGARTDLQRLGMGVTHTEVRTLNAVVARALTDCGVPAFAMSPAAMMFCREKEIESLYLDPLQQLLNSHCVPVLHGDTVGDATRGTTILSTEVVLNACLAKLRPNYDKAIVIYAMNEVGVLDETGKVIPELLTGDTVLARHSTGHDVTGSITGKVQAAYESLQYADDVYIVGGRKPGAITQAIRGEQVGTRVVR